MLKKQFHLIGYALGIAGAKGRTDLGPQVIQRSKYWLHDESSSNFLWQDIIKSASHYEGLNELIETVAKTCTDLAKIVSENVRKQLPFCVIGGDHTSAIGTWSGVYDALHDKGDFGLIWIDAHMDSHTPETSITGHIHGMPLACLLGYGYPPLIHILQNNPKVKPEHICIIGVRSYEEGEAEFLKQSGVKIYFMPEVNDRGFVTVFQEALERVNQNTIGYGLSIDLDGIDPSEAPGVDVPEENGIFMQDLLEGLTYLDASRLVGTEIVEFDPIHDQRQVTEKNLITLINKISKKTLA